MSKELEALEKITRITTFNDGFESLALDGYENEITILRTALERKEKLEKVWKIVKAKEVNTIDFRESLLSFDMTYIHYTNNYRNYSFKLLTEEEFDLLKELLGKTNGGY